MRLISLLNEGGGESAGHRKAGRRAGAAAVGRDDRRTVGGGRAPHPAPPRRLHSDLAGDEQHLEPDSSVVEVSDAGNRLAILSRARQPLASARLRTATRAVCEPGAATADDAIARKDILGADRKV